RFSRDWSSDVCSSDLLPSRTGPPTAAGRWWLLPERESTPTLRSHALAEALLERYGIVVRGAVAAERTPGGFSAVYPVLRAFEERSEERRVGKECDTRW